MGTFIDFCKILSCVKLDITFPSLACSAVSLDALDISGEQHHDIVSFFSSIGSIIGFALLCCTMSAISSVLLCCPLSVVTLLSSKLSIVASGSVL